MTVEASIFSRLSTFAGLTALVSSRIFPVRLPQLVEMPAVSYRRLLGERISAMGSDTGVVQATFQFDCWSGEHKDQKAGTFDECRLVAEQVRLALQRFSTATGTVIQDSFLVGDVDLFEEDTLTYHAALDFKITYEE